jgi:sialate O-acetylesterase
MRSLLRIVISTVLAVANTDGNGQSLRTASVFTDHMVLQQGVNVPVWGHALPGTTVALSVAGVRAEARADAQGRWTAYLPILGYGGPYDLTLIAADTLVLHDVMVGEVWLASGQSNMEWSMGLGVGPDTEKEIAAARYPAIRYYTVARKTAVRPLEDTEPGRWLSVDPTTVRDLSAAAYFFARDLHLDRKVAVGILSSSWGATGAQAWISPDMLSTHPDFRERMLQMDRDPTRWEAIVRQNLENDRTRDSLAATSLTGLQQGVPMAGYDDASWKEVSYPADMEKAGKPGLWGVVWFRTPFMAPPSMKGRASTLRLFLRGREAEVFVNGAPVGKFQNPEREVECPIPERLLREGANRVVVRLYQHWGVGMVGSPTTVPVVRDSKTGTRIELTGPWRCNTELERPLPQMQGYYGQPTVQYNARIAPVIRYGMRGILWYQGEGNASRAFQYRSLFPLLIHDWRIQSRQGQLPFLFVQLANYKARKDETGDDTWAELREAQSLALQLPATGMACAIDIGEAIDIHPRNKLDVGRRLYLAARRVAYGEDIVHSGPVYASHTLENGSLRLRFSSTGGGLMTRDGQPPRGFAIAGADGVYHWADARIEGQTVVLRSAAVPMPQSIRYAWAINPDVNLYNQEGLPATPFRTDRFRLTTE